MRAKLICFSMHMKNCSTALYSTYKDVLFSCSYILSKFNDEETAASICGITADFGDIFSLTGNDTSAPRLVNLTLDVTHIFPIAKPIICPSDGIWNATTNCTVSNAESCFNNATLSKSTIETDASTYSGKF